MCIKMSHLGFLHNRTRSSEYPAHRNPSLCAGALPVTTNRLWFIMAKSPSGNDKPLDGISSPVKPPVENPAAPKESVTPAPITAKPAKAKARAKSKKKPAETKPGSLPTAKKDSRPVSPEARVRIKLASESAAKAGKAMLRPALTPAKKPASAETTPPPSSSSKRVLFVTAECTPLAQTGGLGDMVSGLSKALKMRGHDVRIVMPLYQGIDRAKHGVTFSHSCCVHFGHGEDVWVGIFEDMLDGMVPMIMIAYARYSDRPYIYDDQDDSYRFGVLSKA